MCDNNKPYSDCQDDVVPNTELKRDIELEVDSVIFDDPCLDNYLESDLDEREDKDNSEELSIDDLANNVKGYFIYRYCKEKLGD